MHLPAPFLLAATLLAGLPPSARAQEADVERGRAVIEHFGCAACHIIPGIRGARGAVRPPLTGLGKRVYIAGVLPNSPQSLARWLLDPPAVNPRTAMPRLGLQEQQARDAAAYLSSLR